MAAAERGDEKAVAWHPQSRPLLGSAHLPRPRLDALLDEALEGSLGLVCAPAGSGKTDALVGWHVRRRISSGWLSLVREDNDPAVFWAALASAIQVTGAAAVRSPGQLITRLGARPEPPRVVVLDDYHVIAERQIHEGLDEFLSAVPSLHVLIGSRHDPPLKLSRLRVAGTLHEIRFDELRFDEDETARFLNETMGLDLDHSDTVHLAQRTEGWAVGLRLAALALRHQPDRHAYILQFAADDRHVADYVREEVVAPLPPDVRQFVEQTAMLEQLSAPLCEAVTGVTDAQALLEELDRMNLFITPLDHRRRWYRYHHLFAEWLQLRKLPDAHERHRRAAEWLSSHGLTGDAIGHHLRAGDAAAAADLVESHRWVLVGQGRQHTLREWIQSLPAAIVQERPNLVLAEAWIAYHEGQWGVVTSRAKAALDQASRARSSSRRAIRAEALCLIAGALVATGQMTEAEDVAERALAVLPDEDTRIGSALQLIVGKIRLASGQLEPAGNAFDTACRLEPAVPIVELIARSHRAEILRRQGLLFEAAEAARAALAGAQRTGLEEHPEAAVAHLVLSQAVARVDRNEAEVHLDRGLSLATRIPYEPRERMAASARRALARPASPLSRDGATPELSQRELDVLKLLASPLTATEIASALYVSRNTLKSHTRSIYRKLGVTARHAAIERARGAGLL